MQCPTCLQADPKTQMTRLHVPPTALTQFTLENRRHSTPITSCDRVFGPVDQNGRKETPKAYSQACTFVHRMWSPSSPRLELQAVSQPERQGKDSKPHRHALSDAGLCKVCGVSSDLRRLCKMAAAPLNGLLYFFRISCIVSGPAWPLISSWKMYYNHCLKFLSIQFSLFSSYFSFLSLAPGLSDSSPHGRRIVTLQEMHGLRCSFPSGLSGSTRVHKSGALREPSSFRRTHSEQIPPSQILPSGPAVPCG